jgi:dipeptidyl aminopeptidase/acylaminoacyl peptidase
MVALTDIQPQTAYNWMRSELIHWKTIDGTTSTGILYKPENFDPGKKYPIIFDYYERRSDELNLYIRPKASQDRINIAWYVSNGYLVCVPDIHYVRGEPGRSAYICIVSAARYLSKMPWVDGKKMGIQGHSFGGYETEFVVTHSTLFAAACAASGLSDLISWYGSVPRSGNPKFSSERQQDRMGATLWQIPDRYIDNSPIFKADKVSTPLLLMNNKGDGTVPFAQGVELFTALRRLGKRVWMLQYDGGGHSVQWGKDAMDYSIRMAQFFDHYLKDAPAPKWMTRGIPAKMKGIDDGLAPDQEIGTPGAGLDKKNRQYLL